MHLNSDKFQGQTWDGFHRHLAIVMLAHAFIATYRLESGQRGDRFLSFETVIQQIVREAAIQQLMENLNFDRKTATDAVEKMLQGSTDWWIPNL